MSKYRSHKKYVDVIDFIIFITFPSNKLKYHQYINICKCVLSYYSYIWNNFYYDLRYSNTCVNVCMYIQVYVIGTYVTMNNIEDTMLYYLLYTNINMYVCIKLIIIFLIMT